ncbi:disintegrin and metalloproteinase domain-containing protein 19 [Tachysurus ichikawai]
MARRALEERCWHIARLYTIYFILLLQCNVFCQNKAHAGVLSSLDLYEVTYPQWLNPRSKRAAHTPAKHPSEVDIKITAEGMELVLQLHRNELDLSSCPCVVRVYTLCAFTKNHRRPIPDPPSQGDRNVSNPLLSVVSVASGEAKTPYGSELYLVRPIMKHSLADGDRGVKHHSESDSIASDCGSLGGKRQLLCQSKE